MTQIPTFHDVIEQARVWRNSNRPEDLQAAERILTAGLEQHPYALPIGDELVLVLEKQERDEDALMLLRKLETQFRDAGEETLCRFGKIFKKRADRQIKKELPAAAIQHLMEAEKYYERAYEKSYAFYPRINQLTLRFLRASLLAQLEKAQEAETLLAEVRADAKAMLTVPELWKQRSPDDHIWAEATRGETHLLLGDWTTAEQAYQEAMRLAGPSQFYYDCMASQVTMLLNAYGSLQIEPQGAITDPRTFFALRADL